MNWLDILIFIIISIGIIRGFQKGIIVELGTTIGFILALWGALKFAGFVAHYIETKYQYHIDFLPVLVFFFIFIVVMGLTYILSRIIRKIAKSIMLGFMDSALGAVVGGFKAFIISSMIVFFLYSLDQKYNFISREIYQTSYFFHRSRDFAIQIINMVNEKEMLVWIKEVKEKIEKEAAEKEIFE
jgi:membrane protein required for colicin V production